MALCGPQRHGGALLLLLLLSPAAVLSIEVRGPSPISKVIGMLTNMLEKAKEEKQDEKVRFAAFNQFCKSTAQEKTGAIADMSDESEALQAAVDKATSDMEVLAGEIADLEDQIGTWEKEVKKATQVRKKTKADYNKAHEEVVSSISSTDRALHSIKEDAAPQPAVLLELASSSRVSERQRAALQAYGQATKGGGDPLAALMQDKEDFGLDMDQQQQAPEAAAFESSSGPVIKVVDDLSDKFKEEKSDLEKREANSMHSHNLVMTDLAAQIKQAKRESQSKIMSKSEHAQKKSQAEADLADTNQKLDADKQLLSDLDAECKLKTTDFNERQAVRQGELEAIQKAIVIMSGDKVAAAAFTQIASQPVLAQLRSQTQFATVQKRVVLFLNSRAHKSSRLGLIAARAGGAPFGKVKKMIEDMMSRLMQEANEAATHKGFCDTEMGTNRITRDTKTEEIESLKAAMTGHQADISKFSEQIADNGDTMVSIDAAVSKATAARRDEKEKNAASITDAEAAKGAVGQAIKVLKDFYRQAADAAANPLKAGDGPVNYDPRALAILKKGAELIQESAPYTGQENGGVIGLLEVIESDFTSLISETSTAEDEGLRNYEQFMADSQKDKAVTTKDTDLKESQRTESESALTTAKKEMRGAEKELTAAMEYFEELKPSCVDSGKAAKERTEARKVEIQSLQEALQMLAPDA